MENLEIVDRCACVTKQALAAQRSFETVRGSSAFYKTHSLRFYALFETVSLQKSLCGVMSGGAVSGAGTQSGRFKATVTAF